MKKEILSISTHSSRYIVSSLLIQAGNFFLLPVYTRYLSPADYGIIAILTTFTSLFTYFLLLGQNSSIVLFYYDNKENLTQLKNYISTVTIFLLFFSFTTCIFLSWVGEGLFRFVFPEVPFFPYIFFSIWIVFFGLPNQLSLSLLRVQERSNTYMLISVFQFIIQSAFTIGAIIFLQMGVLGKVEGEFLTRLIFACIGLFMLKNYLSFLFNKQMIIDSLKYGIPLIPHTLSSWVSNLSDRWILNLFVPLSQVGIYSLGAQFGSLLGVLLTGFNYAWVPFVMSSLKENESHAKQKISRLTTYYMGILVLLVLIIVFFAPIVLRIMATQKFYDAIPIIPYIVFAMFWQGIYFMSVNPLFYLKKTQYLAIISIISAIINISCNLLLIPIYGIYGAAISTIISYTFNAILVQGLSQHLFPIAYEYLKIGKIMGSGLIVLIVFYLISSDNMIVESVWNILLLIIYCCLIYILILNVSERREGWIVLNTGIRKCLSLLPFQR